LEKDFQTIGPTPRIGKQEDWEGKGEENNRPGVRKLKGTKCLEGKKNFGGWKRSSGSSEKN